MSRAFSFNSWRKAALSALISCRKPPISSHFLPQAADFPAPAEQYPHAWHAAQSVSATTLFKSRFVAGAP
jgi:hypothetical protein